MDGDSTTIFLTRPFGAGHEIAEAIDEHIMALGIETDRDVQNIEVDGDVVAVCNVIRCDESISWSKMMDTILSTDCDCRFFVEFWSEDAYCDETEHVCVGVNENKFTSGHNFGETFKTSVHPRISPEYLSEDYAVAFLDDLCEERITIACSYERVKW